MSAVSNVVSGMDQTIMEWVATMSKDSDDAIVIVGAKRVDGTRKTHCLLLSEMRCTGKLSYKISEGKMDIIDELVNPLKIPNQ